MLVISSHDIDSAGMFPTLSRSFQFDNPAVVLDDEFQKARLPAPILIESDDSGEYDEIDTHHTQVNCQTQAQSGGLSTTTPSSHNSHLFSNPVHQKVISPLKHSSLQNPDLEADFYENDFKKPEPDFDTEDHYGTGLDICNHLKFNQAESYDSSGGYENVTDHDHVVIGFEGKTMLEHETGSDSSSGFGDGQASSGSGTPSGTASRSRGGTGSGMDSTATSAADSGTPKSIRSSLTEDESGLSLPSPTDAHPHLLPTQTTVTSDKQHHEPYSHTHNKPTVPQDRLASPCGLAPTNSPHIGTCEGGLPSPNSADITPDQTGLPLRTAAHSTSTESGLVPTSSHSLQSQPASPPAGAGINPAFVIGPSYSGSESDDEDYQETAKPRFDQFEDDPSPKDYSGIKTPSVITGPPVQDISGQLCLADSQDSIPQCEAIQNTDTHIGGHPQGAICSPCENSESLSKNAQSYTNCSPSRGDGLVANVCVGDMNPVLDSDGIPLGQIPCYTPSQSTNPENTSHHIHIGSSTSTTI